MFNKLGNSINNLWLIIENRHTRDGMIDLQVKNRIT